MRKMRRKLAVLLVFVLAFTMMPQNVLAAKKKVKLSKKSVTVTVGKTVKVKLKNNKKKVKWTVVSGKKNVKLSKKKKTGVTIHGKKAGKAKVQAKVGKKKFVCKVTVKKAGTNQNADKNKLQRFWATYFNIEKNIYEQLLENPDEVVSGTVKELAEKYGQDVMTMVGFLDGINDSLKVPNPIETMDENTKVNLAFDKEALYKNMVDAKADWLYNLPQWDKIFTEEKKKTLYMEQKKSGTVVKPHKVGRNDPCPCGSGKKYKYCCGR